MNIAIDVAVNIVMDVPVNVAMDVAWMKRSAIRVMSLAEIFAIFIAGLVLSGTNLYVFVVRQVKLRLGLWC